MTTYTTTTYDDMLKRNYPSSVFKKMLYKKRPLLAWVPKNEKMGGTSTPIVIEYGVSGGAAGFATAQRNSVSSNFVKMQLTEVKDYGVGYIDRDTVMRSKTDAHAFASAMSDAVKSAIHQCGESLAIQLYGTGGGSRGRVSSTQSLTGTSVITLQNRRDIARFNVGDKLTFAATDTTSTTVRNNTDGNTAILSASAINRSAGTISGTCNSSTAYLPGLAILNSDYIFREGDTAVTIAGLQGWLPSSAPSASEDWYGVDRSVDSRLYGLSFDGSAGSIKEALVNAAAELAFLGGSPDYVFMNYNKFAELVNELGSQKTFTTSFGSVGFKGITIEGPDSSEIKVMCDSFCPSDRAFMLQRDTWTLHSIGRVCDWQADGLVNKMLVRYNADGYEIRVISYCNLACSMPGYNANIYLG